LFKLVAALFGLIVLVLSWSALDAVPLHAQSLTNANATSNARAVYEYLKFVGSSGSSKSLILGQHAGHGSTITRPSLDPGIGGTFDSNCFDRYVQPIFDQTGKWPGMLSIDYEFNYPRLFEGYNGANPGNPRTNDGNPSTSLKDPNLKLKQWWKEGGLVTINWSPANPWATTPPQNYAVIFGNENLRDLTDSSLPVGQHWLRRLDEIALALDDLQKEGVVVLFRPMQEMDFYGWWPGNRVTNGQGDQFRDVWRHMYEYFTKTKGLNHLIWVFSPTYGVAPWQTTTTGNGPNSGMYPGNDYVDIVAFSAYGTSLGSAGGSSNMNAEGVACMTAYGKPVGIAEAGHLNNDTKMDNVDYILFAKTAFPTASYIVLWQPYPDSVNGKQGIKQDGWLQNHNLAGAFNDPRSIDRASIEYAKVSFIRNDPPPSFDINLAIGKSALASTCNDSAMAACDGDTTTYWDSGKITQEQEAGLWLTVDLGTAKPVSRVKITWLNEN
jgi:mannan endo-1,4-beta-mannosidase